MIHLQSPSSGDTIVTVDKESEPHANLAIGRVVEISIPWAPGPGFRLQIGLGPQQIPEGASVLLEPFYAD